MKLLFAGVCAFALNAFAQSFAPQTSNTTASFRGVSAVDAKIAWASGTAGTFVITTDGGATWTAAKVPGAEKLDFRAVWAIDAKTAYLVSIGTGETSRIYKSTDAGANWTLQFTNPDAKGFFDGIACWDPKNCIVAGDPVDGHVTIFTTTDGGAHWLKQKTPEAIGAEGAFAASNSSLAILGKSDVWLGTTAVRVLHSPDNGKSWTAATSPVRHDSSNAGIFSVYFSNPKTGIAVGGDYSKVTEPQQNIALTSDGGKTWTAPAGQGPAGFRSAVVYVPSKKAWIASGPSGSDISTDGGLTWKVFDTGNYNAVSFAADGSGWAVGARGRIGVMHW